MSKLQKRIAAAGGVILFSLLLLPPWQQAAGREVDYRKDLGRGLIFYPPRPVAVDCYFQNCQTAPASYFHVVLRRDLLIDQCVTVLLVTMMAVWMFRTRADGSRSHLGEQGTKLKLSLILALAVPPLGQFPLASLLWDIPRQLLHRDELWLIPVVMVLVIYGCCTGFIYLTLWIWSLVQRKTAVTAVS